MATLLYPGKEFRITHQEMIKGICKGASGTNYRYVMETHGGQRGSRASRRASPIKCSARFALLNWGILKRERKAVWIWRVSGHIALMNNFNHPKVGVNPKKNWKCYLIILLLPFLPVICIKAPVQVCFSPPIPNYKLLRVPAASDAPSPPPKSCWSRGKIRKEKEADNFLERRRLRRDKRNLQLQSRSNMMTKPGRKGRWKIRGLDASEETCWITAAATVHSFVVVLNLLFRLWNGSKKRVRSENFNSLVFV